MVGGTWTETKEPMPQGIPELSNKAWCTICEMDQVLPNFAGILEDFKKSAKDWNAIYNSDSPFDAKFPGKWDTIIPFLKLLLTRVIRPDRFTPSVQKLITK